MILKKKDYAVYKGDTLICFGSAEYCAEQLGVRPQTIPFYASPAYKKRRVGSDRDHLIVIRIEDD
jgi:hypothetical protein